MHKEKGDAITKGAWTSLETPIYVLLISSGMYLFAYLFMFRTSFVKQPENQFLHMGLTQVSWSFGKVIRALEYNRGQHLELSCIAGISPALWSLSQEQNIRLLLTEHF